MIPLRVLFVEDTEDDALLIASALKAGDYTLTSKRVQTGPDLKAALQTEPWDIILSDFSMPSFTALDALAVLKESGLDIPFIIISGTVGEDTAVKTMKAGAHDYLMKDNLIRLVPAVRREIEDALGRRKRHEAEAELREKGAQLLQSQKMEAIGSLAGGIAHDFNNLLGAILMYCDNATDHLDDAKAIASDLSGIKSTAENAALLTRQLLIFSRKHTQEPKVLALNSAVKEIDNMLRRMIGEHIRLQLDLGSFTEMIRVDPAQLGQILVNLVVNARDAMPKGGQLKIGTRLESVREARPAEGGEIKLGDYVVLTVSDKGSGMSEETRARIFEPFFTTKGLGKGTGLGLSTVYGIVKQHAASITVRTELGIGTEFTVYFPVATQIAADPAVAKAPSAPVEGGNETILVVEDQEELRKSICVALRKMGYVVFEAENGVKALALIQSQKVNFQLVVTDVVMPEMSGSDLAVVASKEYPALKWLFISGYADTSPPDLESLPSDYLAKPFSRSVLLERVKALLDRKI